MDTASSDLDVKPWQRAIHAIFGDAGLRHIVYVPDAGHKGLIALAQDDPNMVTTALTTEEEGIGLLAGAWLGGDKGALLMQSSGVGNCINALTLPSICRIPFLTVVTMRGEWGEFIPWQVPMGQGTPKVLEAMDVRLFRADYQREVGATVEAAADFAFNTRQSAAVLLSQKMIGAKQFKEG